MAQVILINSDSAISNLLGVNLTQLLHVELIPRENAEDAISLLRMLPSIDLIITENRVGEENTARQIYDYLTGSGLSIPLIVTGKADDVLKNNAIVFEELNNYHALIEAAAGELGVSPEALKAHIQPEYSPVSTKFFLSLESVCCDVFIRIKKGPGKYDFVKRFNTTDSFNREVIEKYIAQKLENFWIPSNAREEFATFVSNALVQKLDAQLSGGDDLEANIDAIAESQEVVTKQILEMGFTPSTIQLTESVVESIKSNFEKAKASSPLLSKILNSKSSYVYLLSHVTSIIATECLNGVYPNGGPNLIEGQKIVSYAAFFHDMLLADRDDLCRISTPQELKDANLNPEDFDLVNTHAIKAAALVKDYPHASRELLQVIIEHHGSTSGKGFVVPPDSRISELSKIFIVAEAFAREIFKYQESDRKDQTPVIQKLFERYNTPDMLAIVTALETVLKKNKK